jgi:hypothetical protein
MDEIDFGNRSMLMGEEHTSVFVIVEMLQTTRVEARGTTDDAMNLIAFGQEEFSAVNRGGI